MNRPFSPGWEYDQRMTLSESEELAKACFCSPEEAAVCGCGNTEKIEIEIGEEIMNALQRKWAKEGEELIYKWWSKGDYVNPMADAILEDYREHFGLKQRKKEPSVDEEAIRKETAREISAELAKRMPGQPSNILIRNIRKWIAQRYNLEGRSDTTNA